MVFLVNSNPNRFDFDDVESILLAQENHLNKQKEMLDSVSTLNFTQALVQVSPQQATTTVSAC